jgi:hypothetical protein
MFKLDKCGNAVINRLDVSNSSLIDKLNGGSTECGYAMPLGQNKISNKDLLAIESWITYGAPEHCIPLYEDIKVILDNNKCNGCHYIGSSVPWNYDDYISIFTKPSQSICQTPLIQKFAASQSLLYQKIDPAFSSRCGAMMLSEEKPMNPLDIAHIRDWINSGALSKELLILPVTLSDFDVQISSLNQPILYWQTQSEVNTSHFDIEHSFDGRNFFYVGKRDALLSIGANYHFEHDDSSPGFHYYRLKIVDHDGSFKYSQTRAVRIDNVDEVFNIYPSIISKSGDAKIMVAWYPLDARELVRINIMDIQGQLSIKSNIHIGENQINVSGLEPGIYYLAIRAYNGLSTVKRVVVIP